MKDIVIMYSLAGLTILLGFFALLKQKIYMAQDSGEPIEVQIPFLGKLRTNIPAIVIVFLGCALALITFIESYPPDKVEWIIKGRFQSELPEEIDWSTGELRVFPTDFDPRVYPNGSFEIHCYLPKGKTFEDVIEWIDFTLQDASVKIYPKEEYEKFFVDSASSKLAKHTKTSRDYKPITVERW